MDAYTMDMEMYMIHDTPSTSGMMIRPPGILSLSKL